MKSQIFIALLCLIFAHPVNAKTVTDFDFSIKQIFIDLDVPLEEKLGLHIAPENYQQDWSSIKRVQNITAADGSTLNFTLPKYVDAEILSSLNSEAAHTWNLALRCYGGSANEARAAYAKNTLCKSAKSRLAEIKTNLAIFLASTPSESLDLDKSITTNELAIKERESILQFLTNKIEMPKFHPLLVQLVLEEAAYGFLLPHAKWSCDGLNCAIDTLFLDIPRRIIMPAELARASHWQIGYYLKDEDQYKRKHDALELLKKIKTNEPLTVITGSDNVLEEMRRGFAALHLLDLVSIGRQERDDWGLWPVLSVRLINTIASSYVYINGTSIKFEEPVRILNRIRSSFNVWLPELNIHIGLDDWSGHGKEAISALAEVGAWRKLHEGNQEY